MKTTAGIVHAILIVLALSSCLKAKTRPIDPDACGTIVSYSMEIEPIIHASCMTGLGPGTGCHDAWITDYDLVKNYLDLGIWQNQVLVERIMPEIPNAFGIDSLSDADYTTMKCWIDQGYPKN